MPTKDWPDLGHLGIAIDPSMKVRVVAPLSSALMMPQPGGLVPDRSEDPRIGSRTIDLRGRSDDDS